MSDKAKCSLRFISEDEDRELIDQEKESDKLDKNVQSALLDMGENQTPEVGAKVATTPTGKGANKGPGKGPGSNSKGKGPIKDAKKSPRQKAGTAKQPVYKDAILRMLNQFGMDLGSGSDEEESVNCLLYTSDAADE